MFSLQQHNETSRKQMEKMILDHTRVFGGRDLFIAAANGGGDAVT